MRWLRVLASVLALTGALAVPAGAAPSQDLRVVTWNLWRGGLGAGADNLPRPLDQLVALRPDVLLSVETYGAGPTVLGGDLNVAAASDWTARWQHCPNHFGMAYPPRTTELPLAKGFTDAYRTAHPDACTAEGRTWSPQPTERMITPQRIDLTYTRGLSVTGAHVVDTRLRVHGPGVFYSDHAAVVADVRLSP
ncbi:endonuclease/exonuclease/phosphatase family metal-dependent hydrolase [Crossiella equi]|uniref:Endonuclease/exonuclease/phosphatase family metal-dependent hydrolase n=1 Tax=Crossiella equi TaxID=130796 RepID=A0ABS5AIE8_9PSEU|nr:hypothetical protein [Crossiella equi]MBP2476343.1 endonuclease/exonuclease/phosphatase family metal-dependent hydrolase [Crossiella equi]